MEYFGTLWNIVEYFGKFWKLRCEMEVKKGGRKEGTKERRGKGGGDEGRKEETSHPGIAHGQRYPMPCLE